MQKLKHLKDFFKKNKSKYILGMALLILVDFLQLLVPQVLKNTTDLLQANQLTSELLLKNTLYIILLGLSMAFGRYLWRVFLYGTARELEFYLRDKLFNHLLSLSPSFYNKNKTGDIMAHATNDINSVRALFGHGIMMMIDASFLTILTIGMMIRTTNVKFTLISLVTLPFISLIGRKFSQSIHKRFRKVQESFSNLTDVTQENFSGIRVLKSFVQEEESIENFKNINKDNLDKNLDLVKVSGLFSPLIQLISSFAFFILMIYGGQEVIKENISLGSFIAFNNYLSILVWPMMAIGWVLNIVQRGLTSLERINEILDEKAEIVDMENAKNIEDINGKIQFKNVDFKYPNTEQKVLNNINFTAEANQTLAIIGRTGSGKTSLVSLLLRLYDNYDGDIFIDDINIREFTLKSLRENIGYVPQEDFLFSQSIRENINFPVEKTLDLEEIESVTKFAQVYDNIISFPEAFDTVLGEEGVTLSGGQKQRLSIARAIVKDPKILIFDDSFSSVDTQTEEAILNNIKNLTNKKTIIIISHRISTIQHADKIIVLDRGQIIQEGNHDSLLKEDGLYKYLYEKQLLEDSIYERKGD